VSKRLEGWIQLNFIEPNDTGGDEYVNNYGEKVPRQVRANLMLAVACPGCGVKLELADLETITCETEGCMFQGVRFERPCVWLTRKLD